MQLNTYNTFSSFVTDTSIRLKRSYDGYPSSISTNYCRFSTASASNANIYLPSFNDIPSNRSMYYYPRYQTWLNTVFKYGYNIPIISGLSTTLLANSSQTIPSVINGDNHQNQTFGLSVYKSGNPTSLYTFSIWINSNTSSGTTTIYPTETTSVRDQATIVSQAIHTSATSGNLQAMGFPIPVIYNVSKNGNGSITLYWRAVAYNTYRSVDTMMFTSRS